MCCCYLTFSTKIKTQQIEIGNITTCDFFNSNFWLCSCIYREVPEKDAKDYADSIHAIFVETSAKNAININEVFIEISECVSQEFRAIELQILRFLLSCVNRWCIAPH